MKAPLSITLTPPGSTTPETIDRVISWQVVNDLFTPADNWSLAVPCTSANRKLFRHNVKASKVQIRVGGHLVLTGLIDEVSEDTGLNATDLHVSGRDMAGLLLDCSVPSDRLSIAKASLLDIATRLTSDIWPQLMDPPVEDNGPSRYLVTGGNYRANKTSVGNEITKKPFGKKSPFTSGSGNIRIRNEAIELGETIWPVLAELSHQMGVHIWMSCDGKLTLARPAYNLDPGAYGSGLALRWDGSKGGGNVMGATLETSIAGRCSQYEVAGVSKSSRKALGRQLLLDGGIVQDPGPCFWQWDAAYQRSTIRLYKPGVIRVATEDVQRLTRSVRRTVTERILNAFSYEVMVRDFTSDNGAWWAPDTMVNVQDERNGVIGPMYVARVERSMNLDSKRCKVKLIPPNLWLTDTSEPQVPDADWTVDLAKRLWW